MYARYFVNGPDKTPFEFLHDLKSDPNQLVNITTLESQNDTQKQALAKLRRRCDTLIAQNGPAMKDIPPMATRKPRRKMPAEKRPAR